MNIISLYNQALTGKGEQSINIIIDSKKDFKNRNDFLKMASDALELHESITFTSESKEISKDEFSNYCIFYRSKSKKKGRGGVPNFLKQ